MWWVSNNVTFLQSNRHTTCTDHMLALSSIAPAWINCSLHLFICCILVHCEPKEWDAMRRSCRLRQELKTWINIQWRVNESMIPCIRRPSGEHKARAGRSCWRPRNRREEKRVITISPPSSTMPTPTEANTGPPPADGVDSLSPASSSEVSKDGSPQDIHEVFKFSAKLQFAEALCKLDPIPLNRVQLLLDACPIPSEDTLKFDKAEYYHAVSLLLVCLIHQHAAIHYNIK